MNRSQIHRIQNYLCLKMEIFVAMNFSQVSSSGAWEDSHPLYCPLGVVTSNHSEHHHLHRTPNCGKLQSKLENHLHFVLQQMTKTLPRELEMQCYLDRRQYTDGYLVTKMHPSHRDHVTMYPGHNIVRRLIMTNQENCWENFPALSKYFNRRWSEIFFWLKLFSTLQSCLMSDLSFGWRQARNAIG